MSENINYGRLQNGMKWITTEIPCSHTTSVQILTLAGSRVEPKGKKGIAHLIEHLMFDGTTKHRQPELSQKIYDYGGEMNAFTTNDLVGYHCKMLPEYTEIMLDFFSEIFYHSTFADEDIEKEKNVVLQEITSRLNNPVTLVNMVILPKIAWNDTPVSDPVGGYEDDIKSITRKDIINFMNTYYRPDKMVISVAGQIPENINELLDTYFGRFDVDKNIMPPIPIAKRGVVQETPYMYNIPMNSTEAVIMVAFPYNTEQLKKYIDLISVTLVGTMTSRLYTKLRTEKGLIYSVSPINNTLRDVSMFGFVFSTKNDQKQIQSTIDLALKELGDMSSIGITEQELNRAKANVKSNIITSLEDTMTLAGYYAEKLMYKKKNKELERYQDLIKDIESVTIDDIKKASSQLFTGNRLNLIVIN